MGQVQVTGEGPRVGSKHKKTRPVAIPISYSYCNSL